MEKLSEEKRGSLDHFISGIHLSSFSNEERRQTLCFAHETYLHGFPVLQPSESKLFKHGPRDCAQGQITCSIGLRSDLLLSQ